MRTEIQTKLKELAMRIARDGNDGAFEDVLDILKMIDQIPSDTVSISLGGVTRKIPVGIHKEIGDLLANTKKIPAIKLLRETYKMQFGFQPGLLESKIAIEDTQNWDTWDTAPKPIYLLPEHCASCVKFTTHPSFIAAKARKEAKEASPEVLDYDPLNVGYDTEAMEEAINADPDAKPAFALCVRCGSQILDPSITGQCCGVCVASQDYKDD